LSATLIGGFVVAPALVEANQGNPADNDFFTNVEYTKTSDGIGISATLREDVGPHIVYFKYGEVKGIGFGTVNATVDMEVAVHVSGTHVTDSVQLDSDKLYIGYLTITQTNDSGEEAANSGSDTYWIFLTKAYDGDITALCVYGCLIAVINIVLVYVLIMVFSNMMRGRMEKTRVKMEKEGRLYPQGYGRCGQCGTVVLPGEVNCRKCGAYIDRPEEMKPKKKDFFECSECGAEVPNDAKECPKCGAVFDEDETEVMHADGTVEITNEITNCPECGAAAPATATFCTKCGAKFGSDKK
jgi:ribosomal protein L40E